MTTAEELHDEVAALARELVRRRSVTPDDAGCQELIAGRLSTLGFAVEHMRFGETDNLWARHGTAAPLVVLAGHTDVVPPGPEHRWSEPPFAATVRDGMLWGRGAADMKGSVAAMIVAAERYVRDHPDHPGSIAILLTSDEEGDALDGTTRVIDTLVDRGERIDHCVMGEPSSEEIFGDTIKIGRRGTLTGTLTVNGIQGHVAYPQRARNPVHELAPALAELVATEWDRGNEHFPPTGFQIAGIQAGTGADNVIPGQCEVIFNFRHNPESTSESLQARTLEVLDRHGLDYDIEWRLGGEPFITEPGPLTEAAAAAIEAVTGQRPALSTAGGTSDARVVAPTGAQVIELGPLNATVHQVDERISLDDLALTAAVDLRLLEMLLGGA
jgi:succinyl-diaminopimelate desuccinylase